MMLLSPEFLQIGLNQNRFFKLYVQMRKSIPTILLVKYPNYDSVKGESNV